jgi:hypothetical protein
MAREGGPGPAPWVGWIAIGVMVLCTGCSSRPRAPALENEPVYENKRAGFRFVAPEGWVQHAKADLPPGKLEKECLLVNYETPIRGKMAFLEVSLADLPESTDLASYLADSSYGVGRWRPAGAPENVTVHGVPAVRYSYTARQGKDQLTKEVVVFRRSDRVYFFTGVYPSSNSQSRDQVREAAMSTIWEG